LLRTPPTFVPRAHRTALPGWRIPSSRRPALRDCSLVIPAGDGDDVPRSLDSFLAVPDAPGEVVIVDAGPNYDLGPRVRAWREAREAPFTLIYVAAPSGLTRQRNIGVDLSTRDFVFFLDPGLEPLPGYFAVTRGVFDLDRDRCVGGVTGVIVNRGRRGSRDPLIYARSGICGPGVPPFSGLRRVDVLPGAAAAWRREVFTTRRFSCFFGACPEGEDIEMSLRVGKRWTLLACGEARVKRVAPSPQIALSYESGRAVIRNRHFVWRRHISEPGFRNEARFWLRAVLDVVTAFGSFCLRPWDVSRASHAAGLVAGISSCLADPPRFTEPPARREYFLTTGELAAQTGNG
jgi:glycosyltransferase involved in cell wall biosynthesis